MEERFVDMTELPARLGICKRSIAYLRAQGKFPQPRQITKQRVGWLESEIAAWMRARPVVGGLEGMQ